MLDTHIKSVLPDAGHGKEGFMYRYMMKELMFVIVGLAVFSTLMLLFLL
ncbi:hypothetical protein GGE07_000411 [Sinorhizobium terangae]|uniref:Uncharacterized protein n=1 Tax=Sinorhizobium terangae TaxID=110322 RepID=A0A6N7LE43_SINTE|nr:hypothetical protein [Sinorhizobium terangae]MBB4183798.1 hypothetical protein [Sinorhizobium terangae]MQX15175.1 hypothetical protein [Sinorhizobium terangae]